MIQRILLTYELYLRNMTKKRTLPPARSVIPIKKIFVNNDVIELDKKDYGPERIKVLEQLQEELSMPSSTTEKICLPDWRTAGKVPSPYIVCNGEFCNNEKNEAIVTIRIEGKDETTKKTEKFVATMKNNKKINYEGDNVVQPKIYDKDEASYYINKEKLLTAYIQAGILNNEKKMKKDGII